MHWGYEARIQANVLLFKTRKNWEEDWQEGKLKKRKKMEEVSVCLSVCLSFQFFLEISKKSGRAGKMKHRFRRM
jgi:hypothetical protein